MVFSNILQFIKFCDKILLVINTLSYKYSHNVIIKSIKIFKKCSSLNTDRSKTIELMSQVMLSKEISTDGVALNV